MIGFQKTTNTRQRALRWWKKLSASQKRTYEYKMFGDGERWEDNRLTEDDILNMHDKFELNK